MDISSILSYCCKWWSDEDDGDEFITGQPLERCGGFDYSAGFVAASPVSEDNFVVAAVGDTTFFGVFDGHGGTEVSLFVKERLIDHIQRAMEDAGGAITPAVMEKVFTDIDNEFYDKVRNEMSTRKSAIQAGTCCLVGAIKNGRIIVANAGDSRAVLGRRRRHVRNELRSVLLSVDHNVRYVGVRAELRRKYPDEDDLVFRYDGCWRLKGILQVSRAIGDHYLKVPAIFEREVHQRNEVGRGVRLGTPVLTAEPTVVEWVLIPDDQFVIFASAGFWDLISDNEAVSIVQSRPREGVGEALVEAALRNAARIRGVSDRFLRRLPRSDRRRLFDDTTVLVVFLRDDAARQNAAELPVSTPAGVRAGAIVLPEAGDPATSTDVEEGSGGGVQLQ